MDISRVDTSAIRGHSALHRAAPAAKLVAAALMLLAVVVSTNVLIVAALALVMVGVAAAMRLPLAPMLALAAYPGLFALLFAFAASAGPLSTALIVAKAVSAALVAVLLMFTTPYPQVFAPIQRVVPAVIGDVILMTYRSLFLVFDKFTTTLTAARLRAGLVGGGPVRSARSVIRALGAVLLFSVDLSQRTHDVMYLRGYDGRLVVTPQPTVSRALDASVIVVAAALGTAAVSWRLWWPWLNPYSWIPFATAVAAFGACIAIGAARKDRP